MERRGEQEMMVQREDLRNQWQLASTHFRPEKSNDGLCAKSYRELEEWARWRYHHSLTRRRRLQGEMWREIQNALNTEWIAGSAGRSVSAEPSQRPSVNISQNTFNRSLNLSSYQPPPSLQPHQPPYTSGKHHTSGKMLNSQCECNVLSSSWSRPPDYTPPPPYSPRPDPSTPTRTLQPDGSLRNFSEEDRCESRPHNKRQTATFSHRRAGTVTFPGPDRTQHQQELWPSDQQQEKHQQQVFTPQSSGHHEKEKYQTSYSDLTLTKQKRKRRFGGTVFCLVSHMGEPAGLSSSPNDQPFTCQSFPLLKSSTTTETGEQVHLADEAVSCLSLTSFSPDPTPEEPRENSQNQSDQNVKPLHHVEELRKEREELKEQSNEEIHVTDLSKKKHEDTDSEKNMDNIAPAVSFKSSTPVEPHHQTTLKFPLWKEPKSHHGSNGVLKKNNKANRSISRECQYEQSEPRNNAITDENSGLVVIDATCVVIKVEFIIPPEKEHVQYVNSCPADSSEQSSDSNHNHKTSDQTTGRRSAPKTINRARHTSSQVQPQYETLKERAERILGIVLQNSFNEAHTQEETTQVEDSSTLQVHNASGGSAEAKSECCLKAECENAEIPKKSTSKEENPGLNPEAEAMLEISEVTHKDAVNTPAGLEIMAMMRNRKQDNEVNSVDRKFMLEEKIPTAVSDIKENQVKDSAGGRSSGEHVDSQNLQQTILRNTRETFSQKPKRREDNFLHETDKRCDLNQRLRSRAEENTNEAFSQEDTLTEGNSSNLSGDHVGDISHLLNEAGELQNHCSILPHSYEPDSNKIFDQERWTTEEKPSIMLHNLHRKGEKFGLEKGHHQENLLNLQNLCSNLLSTSETLHQENSPNQNLSYLGDPHISSLFLGHYVENTNESFAHEGEHLSDVWPKLVDRSVLNIRDTIVHDDILREDRPSLAKQDANNLSQTLPGNNMENMRESCDHEDVLYEGNISGDVNNLHPSFSVKDIQEPFDGASHLHEDGVELLSSVLLGEDVHHCVYRLYEGKLPETTDMNNFSPDASGSTEENPESFQHEADSEKNLLSDDLQNLCPVLFSSSVENSSELFKREDNEDITSPSPDLHTLSKDKLPSNLLSTLHAEISPHPPDCVSSIFPSPPLPAACSSHSRSSECLTEITSIHAQVCSSAASTAGERDGVKQCPQSLWDAMSRIRKHTSPDSETEEEAWEFWESEENTEDGVFNLSENPGIKEEESELEERSGHVWSDGNHRIKEEQRHVGERKDDDEDDDEDEDDDDDDDDDSVSSSSVDSQDTVIEGEGQRNFLQTDEEEEKN